ncbi:imelysin family protein [Frigidibacter sp. ROC022]|uniref:imelysin family protein n=1 Tax=Frigidibacter sp. ROC022 TaxID=2971796 RepID=UPI00215AEA2A|nr:imelysin family protein [Frigidibacter sp. ROC022]MCR8723311.1 peptidase [Frigidibacter sp. ROC022]
MRPTYFALAALAAPMTSLAQASDAVTPAAVVKTYADIGEAVFTDALAGSRDLQDAVDALLATPSPETLEAARAAWIKARESYMQSEAFRFGNPSVDDLEPMVNSWPLDEGLIDYVDPSYGGATDENEFAALNVVATPSFSLGPVQVDASKITPELIADTLQEADGIETNVASGWHAVEFLLWGQDLHGTGPGAGERPWTDYAQGADCTNGNCDRRAAYLSAATELLVKDMQSMADLWSDDGTARVALEADPEAALGAMLTGLGSLSFGELAGERMKLGLLLHDPEEEQDCFSDNTHNAHYYDVVGIQNVWLGRYTRADGSVLEGPSLAALVAETDAGLAEELTADIAATLKAMMAIKTAAEGGEAYDQQIGAGNEAGNARVQAGVDGLVTQTKTIERVIAALGAESTIEGSDSLQ